MEIKATLQKPYTDKERLDFIVEYNHSKGYEIRETETELEALGNTEEEVEQRKQEEVNHLTMTALDMITAIKSMGSTDEQIEQFLASNLAIKHQLQFCQNVYCGVAKSFCPVTIGNITILPENMEHLFKVKNGVE